MLTVAYDPETGLRPVRDSLDDAVLSAQLEPQEICGQEVSSAIDLAFLLMQEYGKGHADIGRHLTPANVTQLEWLLSRAKAALRK